ncbi:general secretion pathway protein GspB [Alteromonas macleodii]|uniref:general secretion pathway protein GspB n=1 Tax=Alteromonas macleodii TaxID=28108 RepID=UPI002981B38C|nr:general secretion pathway protein GspB [Alteromonas macleodii]MDW5284927.1 general secretion pathway protein GspB [Alteromonas macleodii]
MSNIVAIDHLKPGMVIVQITKQNGPVKIRKSGLVTSDAMVQGLSEMGVQEVEIDPEQTVEIAPAVHHRTQTQALLRGEHDTTAKFDKSLNEQFNRSLFLPTVEGLPSAWKLYTKQAALFAVVILGGACIGFTAATVERWWPMFTAQSVASVTTPERPDSPVGTVGDSSKSTLDSDGAPSPSNNSNKPASPNALQSGQDIGSSTVASNNSGNVAAVQQGMQANGSNPPVENLSAVSGTNSSATDTQASYNNDVSQRSGADSNNDSARNSSTNSRQTASSDAYEGKVLNEEASQSDVSVSPELMARFNAAVAALDSKAEDGAPAEEQTRVTVKDELPRVDQLPVRLLTRLPTMNFSAHMYASRPADRWVRVNGRQIGEGDWIADRVQIVNIEAQRVVLAFEDEIFTMAALTDW